jgi:FixJ family two-component response regulator
MLSGQVYVVDDDRSMREALLRALQREGYAVCTFATPVELLAEIDLTPPGVIVLDVQMPTMSGLDLQQEFASRGVTMPIIFISGQSQPQQIIQGMKKGAVDFLLKPFELGDLIRSIEEALAKMQLITKASDERRSLDERYSTLTRREREVFRAIGEGDMLKDIAIRLGVSNSVIKFHKANLMQKLDCKSLSELVSIHVNLKRTQVS